ncbi:MAG: hypothetical protein H6730_11505 [Deltaproteobacteria bacterium]|nr:hypothetical protein [Deltaproteobacteria bacterium]
MKQLIGLLGFTASAIFLTACSGESQVECTGAEQLCGTSCVLVASDPRHCGGCNQACDTGEVCSAGACVLACGAGQTDCDGACVDLQADGAHCGACGTACALGEVCSSGTCALSCPTGQEACGTGCFDTQTAPNHCGACGTACGTGEVCVAGACTATCPTDQTACEGQCFDTRTARLHCGACGTACDPGESCSGGSCVTSCPEGQDSCEGGCFDLGTSVQHCGACGTACASGSVCVEGACAASCPTGQELCGDACVTTDTDPANCGGCGTACAPGSQCRTGACVVECATGLTDCGGSCRDTAVDRANCGGCGTTCAVGEACLQGACTLVCGAGQSVCNGSCTDTATSEANCGACGTTCGGNERCVAGQCTLTCAGATPDVCNGSCTNLASDPANCGACGAPCGADLVCSAGACVSQCQAGLTACGGACVSTANNPLHCGGCGVVCTAGANAAAVCVAGACNAVCEPGVGDCDQDLTSPNSNGCETDLTSSAGACGACGVSCQPANGTGVCAAGQCGLGQCDVGFDDCDSALANGCEAELATDDLNCGACNVACGVGTACQGGACVALPPTGEDCSTAIPLLPGTNSYPHEAVVNDYMPTINAFSCWVTYNVDGGDVVFRYTATATGAVSVTLQKPGSQRYNIAAVPTSCGLLRPELACFSEFTATSMSIEFGVQGGQDYFVYVMDTTSGTSPLPNPLVLTVTENLCTGSTLPAVVTSVTPAQGRTTTNVAPAFQFTFSRPVRDYQGVITLTGDKGTRYDYDLALAPTEVVFSNGDDVMNINAGVFLPNEVVSVTWSNLVDDTCGMPIAPPQGYSVNIFDAPCVPGLFGMIGTNVSVIPTGHGTSFTEYYAAADRDPNGWVYSGGTTQLFRYSKAGGVWQDVEDPTLAGPITPLGYAMLIDGDNIYVMDDSTATTLPVTGRLTRLSVDRGATFQQVDMATWPTTAPQDDFRGLTSYGGRIYMITQEGTSTVPTEIWSIDPSAATLPDTAVLEGSFLGYYNCAGLAMDATYYYTLCTSPTPDKVIRVNRLTMAVDVLSTAFDLISTAGVIYAPDVNNDGDADFLYAQSWYEEGYYICNPTTATPYSSSHFRFNTGASSQYGMGFDPVSNTLWMVDDGSRDLIRVQ